MRKLASALTLAVASIAASSLATASPAGADSYEAQQHRAWAVRQLGPPFCAKLDAEPTALNVHYFTKSVTGLRLPDGWYFFEDEAEQITSASIADYCPHHQGLYYGTQFGEGFLQGLLGG